MDKDSDYEPSLPSSPSAPSSPYADQSLETEAQWRPLPRHTYRSIEYTGPMARPDLILRVVPQADIDECFNANIGDPRQLEMRYRPGERTAVPVRGTRVASQKVLVKVTKRRRRGQDQGAGNGAKGGQRGKGAAEEGGPASQGVFTADIVGSIPQTVRFRSMADYQYTPSADSHVAQLAQSLVDLDYDAILGYQVPPLNEVYMVPTTAGEDGTRPQQPFQSIMSLQPTPIASTRQLSHIYNFKPNPQTIEEKIWDEEKGEYRTRYVNKSRGAGWAMITIGHGHTVPTEPEDDVKDRIPKLDQRLYKRLLELLEERPVWMRYSLLAQFTDEERYEIESNKMYLPAVAFTYGAGAYWKTIVRWGYDPCADPSAHKYQRVYVYLDVKRGKNAILNPSFDDDAPAGGADDESRRPSFWWEHDQERRVAAGLRPPLDPKRVYIYDGKHIHRNKPDYQLIDISDPYISKWVYDPISLGAECDAHSGWYRRGAFELIKALLRIRYAYLRDTNTPAPPALTDDIVDAYERALEAGEEEEAVEGMLRRMAVQKRGMR